MARPTKAEKRDVVLGVRLTMRERVELQERASIYGRSSAEFMRDRALGYRLPERVTRRQAKAAVATAINSVGINLNQIAKRMNQGEGAPPELLDLVARIHAELDRLYDPALSDPDDYP